MLYTLQARGVGDLAPEGEPDSGDPGRELFRRKQTADNRLKACTRRCCSTELAGDAGIQIIGEAAKRCFQKTVLIFEVMRHKSGGKTGPAADGLQGRGGKADVMDRVDGRADQLLATNCLSCGPGHTLLLHRKFPLRRRASSPLKFKIKTFLIDCSIKKLSHTAAVRDGKRQNKQKEA